MRPPQYDPNWPAETQALYRHDMQEIWDRSISRHIWNQYHNQLEIYLEIASEVAKSRKITILDVGCAQATLALQLAERGHRVVANDLRQPFLEYAESRYTHGDISFVCGNVLETTIGGKFDLIFANQIIEHMVYPKKLVGRLKSMLKPGGRLVVTTPNWHYFRNDLPSFTELVDPVSYESKQFTADADGHFFAYSAAELKSVFAAETLQNVRVRYFETPWISGHMKVRHLHTFVPRSVLKLCDNGMLATPIAKWLAHQLMVMGDG
jgi:2-polyprenyl-3-methyl-5-hydroxy-6-metoxy-1,4-benzoquinol methylase